MPPPIPQAIEAKCNSICRVKCDRPVLLEDGTYDGANRAHIGTAKRLGVCEVRRQACEDCLNRLENAGYIRF